MKTVIFPEGLRMEGDDRRETEIFGDSHELIKLDVRTLSEVSQEHCDAAHGLMIWRIIVSEQDFDRFPNLQLLVRMGVGYDSVDRKAAAARGIMICNVPDYGTSDVALFAVTMALTLRRGLLIYHEDQRTNRNAPWEATPDPLLQRISTQTFGIIGLGRIGTAAANFARSVGFKVVFYDPYRDHRLPMPRGLERMDSLAGLLQVSDVLSLHAPLTPETCNIVGAKELAMLPSNAVVINTARGAMLDLEALAAEMKSGHLAGCGLDVLAGGDPPDPLPEIFRAYRDGEAWTNGRVVITPHIAGRTPSSDTDLREKSASTVVAALAGQPYNVITPEMF